MKNQELDARREEALRRYRMIAPLLDEGTSEWEKKNARWLIRSQEEISARTLRRYVAAFKEGGFDALMNTGNKFLKKISKELAKNITKGILILEQTVLKLQPVSRKESSNYFI